MKKNIFCIASIIMMSMNSLMLMAQREFDPSTVLLTEKAATSLAPYQKPIEVQRFNNWGKDYLTVTNNWDGLFANIIQGELPACLSLITEINGKSTVEMSVPEFYNVMKENKECSLKYVFKENGVNTNHTCTFTNKNYYIPDIEKQRPAELPSTITMLADNDVDFINYNTFGFVIGKNDPLTDKSIFTELSIALVNRGLKYSESNPDIALSLTKSLVQNTSSTYVPKQTQIVNTGSYTSVNTNKKTGKPYVTTTQFNQAVTTGGYTHTSVAATFKFVLTMKDCTRIVDGDHPVIWKIDYNRFSSNNINLMDEIKSDVLFYVQSFPFNRPMFSYGIKTRGLVFQSFDDIPSGVVYDVLPGTDAWNKGVRPGLQCVRGYLGGWSCLVYSCTRGTFFKPGKGDKRFHGEWLWIYCVPISPCYNPINKQYTWFAHDNDLIVAKVNYIFRDPFGGKMKVKKGFKQSTITFEYIP